MFSKTAILFPYLLALVFVGDVLNVDSYVVDSISISDEKPDWIFPIDGNSVDAIRTADKVYLKILNGKLRSCKNNVIGIKMLYGEGSNEFIEIKFKQYKFGNTKTENFNIEITNTLAKRIWYKTKINFEPIYEPGQKDGCFNFTARQLIIEPHND